MINFRLIPRGQVEKACLALGWTVDGGGTKLAGTPCGGSIYDDDDPYLRTLAHLREEIATAQFQCSCRRVGARLPVNFSMVVRGEV
ncbi:hypothetical protein [Nocardia sp. CDC160]|uniref:hypothetical protein n=1 Tax=Nocardia sp. CDC160 TaxID=3112166 RepID=UPI002DBB2968|nr:hypothetical protein [Nocardia sp. CDC160]MEC3914533.1 hypothetical protein [Nocardia sp. CDC160]